jgi:putative phosphoesterase
MLILVFSDSHGGGAQIKALLEKYDGTANAALHLGDHDRDLLQYEGETGMPLLAVAGNCDGTSFSPFERFLTFGAHKIFMTHGNMFQIILGFGRLLHRARERNADVCLFGHTHRAEVFTENGVFFMNPGSVTKPRGGKPPSYGLLTLGDCVSGEIIFL